MTVANGWLQKVLMEFTAAVTVQDLHLIPSSLRNVRRTKTGANVKNKFNFRNRYSSCYSTLHDYYFIANPLTFYNQNAYCYVEDFIFAIPQSQES